MDVFEAIQTRRSVRSYSSRPIPVELMRRMRQALCLAPSARNLQPWHFIFVTEPGLRKQLAEAAHKQHWMGDAPTIVVACGFADQAYTKMGGSGNSVEIDVTIAMDHLTLAAVADGLATCWIGSFNESQVAQLLNVPSNAKVVAMTPLGYPETPELNHPVNENRRKPPREIFSLDHYGNPLDAD